MLIHCQFYNEYNETIYYLTAQGIFRMAVPIFFLINGYFFSYIIVNKKIKKWTLKGIILYSVWMIIYSPFWFSLNIKLNIIFILFGYYHLWYINAMIISGILLYILKRVKPKNLLILAFLLFLVGVIIQYLANYHILKLNIIYSYRNFLFLGLPFFIIGYLIKVQGWKKRITCKQVVFLISIGSIILIAESYLNFVHTRTGIDNLFSLIIISPLIYIYVLKLNIKYKVNSKNLSLICTSVYLVHPLIMKVLTKFHQFDSTLSALLTLTISVTISFIILKINKKINILL